MIEDDAPVIYGIEFQSRALTAHVADTDEIRFFVGTQSLKAESTNQIHEINFDDETNSIEKRVYLHEEGELWHLACPPTDKTLLATCYSKLQASKCEMQAALWKIPSQVDENSSVSSNMQPATGGGGEDSKDTPTLQKVHQLCSDEYKNLNKVIWHPTEDNQLITLADTAFLLWDLEGGNSQVVSTGVLEGKGCSRFTACKWNPHQNSKQIATCNDSAVKGWDVRAMRPGAAPAYTIEHAHGQLVRDVDFNPNRQYYVATCGDDCQLKVWDIRGGGGGTAGQQPLKTLKNHSHWVWCVRYNQSHDQLLLTSSSDWRVVLSNIVSLSSEPYGHLIDEEDELDFDEQPDIGDGPGRKKTQPEDGVIAKYEEHEDSVYVAEWSAADPWLFASLSFDGRLVINRVPRAEKYKILL